MSTPAKKRRDDSETARELVFEAKGLTKIYSSADVAVIERPSGS